MKSEIERTAILANNVSLSVKTVQRLGIDAVDRDITQDVIVDVIDVLKSANMKCQPGPHIYIVLQNASHSTPSIFPSKASFSTDHKT